MYKRLPDSYAYAVKLAEETGKTLVHPFDDLAVATGQGSIAMEIIQELRYLNVSDEEILSLLKEGEHNA